MDTPYLDAELCPHQVHECIMVLARFAGSDHIVKQQFLSIGGCQAPHFKPWPVNDHLAQLANIGMNTKF